MRERGLNARALEHVLGLRYPMLGRLGATRHSASDGTPASVPVLLFCGRKDMDADLVQRCFGDDTALLEILGLLERSGSRARAPVAIAPLPEALCVCPWDRVPDDSSLHLCGALPASADSWLDVGTGSAFAPLMRPGLAPAITGSDIDVEALELAEIGLALSGIDHVELTAGDLFDSDRPPSSPSLITFNAPNTRDVPALMARFWERAETVVARGGEVLVHCRFDAAVGPEAPGDVVVSRYTPAGVEAFAVVSWRPDRPNRRRNIDVELDEGRPHVRRDWNLPADSR